MRNAGFFLTILAALIAVAAAATPNVFSPFYQPILHSFFGTANSTSQELRRRQDSSACPDGYGNNCAGLGNAALCCADDSTCAVDAAGNVACCPEGAACTGSISASTRTASSTGVGGVVGGGQSSSTTTTTSASSTDSFIFASSVTTTTSSSADSATTTTASDGGGVIIQPAGTDTGTGSSLATVSNPYFPIAIIPAAYSNADACSSAYSSCQSDIASCTAVLEGNGVGGGGGGITINAPNGGTTVLAATTSYASDTASSICASLSTRACGTFTVQQCSRFGSGAGTASATASPAAAYVQQASGPVFYVVMIAVVMVAG